MNVLLLQYLTDAVNRIGGMQGETKKIYTTPL